MIYNTRPARAAILPASAPHSHIDLTICLLHAGEQQGGGRGEDARAGGPPTARVVSLLLLAPSSLLKLAAPSP